MLDTCLHKLGHFFVGERHFTGKDFLLDAGREVVRDVDASRAVSYTHLDVYKRQALLKKNSFESSSWVEPMDFTSNLSARLRSLYTQ